MNASQFDYFMFLNLEFTNLNGVQKHRHLFRAEQERLNYLKRKIWELFRQILASDPKLFLIGEMAVENKRLTPEQNRETVRLLMMISAMLTQA